MKILFYSYKSTYSGKFFGGAEKSMTLLAESMVNLGCEAHYLTGVDYKRFSFSRRILKKGVQVHFLPVLNLPLLRFSFIRKLNDKIRSALFYSYMDNEFRNFDVVFVFNEYPALYQMVKWKVSNSLKCKVIYRTAGLYWHNNILKNHPSLRGDIEYSFNYVDSVNFISEEMRLLNYKVKDEFGYSFVFKDEFVLDIGVDVMKRKVWSPKNNTPFTIVMVARFSDYAKRQDILLEAFKNWNKPDTRLIFFGDGPMIDHYRKTIRSDMFLSNNVELRGFAPLEEIEDQLINSNLFCLCTDYEGVPQSVLEALSIGIPVLVSDIDAHKEIINPDKNGFVVSNNSVCWTNELNRISEMSSDKLRFISENAIEFIKSNHSIEVSTKSYIAEFNRLIRAEK